MEPKTCLNLSALIHLDFESQLKACSAAGFSAVGPRSVNIDSYLSSGKTLDEARWLLDRCSMTAIEYDFFPDWIYCAEDERPALLQRFDGFCRTASALGGAGTVLVAPTLHNGKNDLLDIPLAAENLREIAGVADSHELIVGLEFLPWTRIDSIGRAWNLIRESGTANTGIVLDCFHYFEGSSTVEELYEVPVDRIALCHLNDMNPSDDDILVRTREQRVLPGEGQYRIEEILAYLAEGGYDGYYSLEILNTGYREMDPTDVAVSARRSLEDLFDRFPIPPAEKPAVG